MIWRNDWTGFFSVYFKCCYYLCLTPLHFVWDKQVSRYRVTRNRLQSAACLLHYALLGVWYLKALRKIPLDSVNKNPDVYFSLAFTLNALYCHNVVFATMFWKSEKKFLAILNFDSRHYAHPTRKNKLIALAIFGVFTALPFLYTIYGHTTLCSCRWSPTFFYRCLVAEGHFTFSFNGHNEAVGMGSCGSCNEASHPPLSLDEISILNVTLCVVAFLMENARQVFGFYNDFFPLICALSLWTCIEPIRDILHSSHCAPEQAGENSDSCSFWSVCPSSPASALEKGKEGPNATPAEQSEGKEMLERYKICRSFSRTVNWALGRLLFAYVFSSIMYLSTSMDAMLVLQDWFGKLRVAFFFSVFILMFFVGSELVNQVDGLRTWLSDPLNNSFLSERSLLVMINEVAAKPICVSGNGMFTITYSTFMTVMTTTVTFFIIILQFQKYDREERDIPLQLRNILKEMLHSGNITASSPHISQQEN